MKNHFLKLVRLGIGQQVNSPIENVDWEAIQSLAVSQGLSAVVLDGIELLPENQRPSKAVMLPWIGCTLNQYEQRYSLYCKSIASLAAFYKKNGYKMMVLKGYACSLDWPKPEHRPCGDIDIWQFGEQKAADDALRQNGITVDKSHHHHTVFSWKGFTVENHYDFINMHHHKSHAGMEKLLKELGQNDCHYKELLGEKVYIPSPQLHAIFFLKHSMLHFVSGEFSLRNLLDWAFFVKAHNKEIDWVWLEKILARFGMIPMYNIFNAICVSDLGFDVRHFHNVQFDKELKDRVLNEILFPQFRMQAPNNILLRIIFKYRRWKANGWKHALCYKESMWSAFWSGVWNHLLKPTSI